MAREGLGLVGAAVGGYFGGPKGAQIGFAVGSAIGGYIDPVTIPAPSLGEAPIQTGRDGVPLPIVWGVCHLHGNMIQVGPIEEVTTKERQGKGGSTKVESTRRYRSFAIGLCEGPIEGVSRIWENDRLVYDTRTGSVVDAIDQTDYASSINIYLGTDDQLPDPDLESITGVGNQPAYRDDAYIVWPNYDITDFGSAIPQYRFEVNGGIDASVTSKPYPIELVDGVQPAHSQQDFYPHTGLTEGISQTITPVDGVLSSPLNETDFDIEGIDKTVTPQDSVLKVSLYETDFDIEGIDKTVTPQDGDLSVELVSHDYEEEGINASVTPQDGNMT